MKYLPVTLRVAVWWWGAAAVVVAAFGIASLAGSDPVGGERLGLVSLAILLLGLATVIAVGAWQLARGRLGGRGTLTTFGVMAGVPMLVSGGLRLTAVGVALLVGVVPLWLPPSLRFFKEQSRAARADRRAARKAAGRGR